MGEEKGRKDFVTAAANYKHARHRISELKSKPVHRAGDDQEQLNLENSVHLVDSTLDVIESGYGRQARLLICALYVDHKTQEETARTLHLTSRQVRYRAKKIMRETFDSDQQSGKYRMGLAYLPFPASEITAAGQN